MRLLPFHDDYDYAAAGAVIVDRIEAWSADVELSVNAPSDAVLTLLAADATLVSWLSPGLSPAVVDKLERLPITAWAVDALPRTSR